MVPVQTAFSKMSRVVRDMNKTLGKNVELVFVGADTEADLMSLITSKMLALGTSPAVLTDTTGI